MKNHFISICVCATSIVSVAQNEVDALRYSMTNRPATSRSYAMGSSFGALGADLSSFFSNPAGVGQYKRGGFEFSLALNNQLNTATYSGNETENSSSKLTLNNFGIIGSKKPKSGDWKAFNFGIGYAKTNNFNDKISVKGNVKNTTLMDVFASHANGIDPDLLEEYLPFTSSLAYQVYAINPTDTIGTNYFAWYNGGQIEQSKNITRSGAQSETSFAFGGNYKDFLLIGGSILFQGIHFKEKGFYSENFDSGEPLQNLTFTENIEADGTGVGLKLGVILKPTEWVRMGVAYHSGTVISMTENYTTSMTSAEMNGTPHDWTSPLLVTSYNLRTPSRFMGNMAFVLGKSGVVSADYEYTNYETMRMTGTGNNHQYNYEVENSTIGTIYRGTHRVGAGMEFRVKKSFAVRGGAIYQQSPFANGAAINNPWITYTGGLGYKSDYFFCDLSAGYSTKDLTYYLYESEGVQPATIKKSLLSVMMSLGFKY